MVQKQYVAALLFEASRIHLSRTKCDNKTPAYVSVFRYLSQQDTYPGQSTCLRKRAQPWSPFR